MADENYAVVQTLAAQSVTTATAVNLLAGVTFSTAGRRSILISVESNSIRLGDSSVTSTKGPLVPAGTLVDLPMTRGELWACGASGTATVNVTIGGE